MQNSERWLLELAATPSGFTPNEESVKELCVSLKGRGLLCQSNNYPFWMITDAGRKALAAEKD